MVLTGEVSLSSLFWNEVIQPGETNISVGFCVNRQQPNGTLPEILGSAATFQ